MNYKEPNKNQKLDQYPVEALRGLESMKNILATGETMHKVAIISGALPCPEVLKALNVLSGIEQLDVFSHRAAERLREAMQIFPSRREVSWTQ